jgi:sugar phosphate isomerase/epimerase
MRINQVAVQLYTVREHLRSARDYAQSLRRIRAIGYQAVEIAGPRPIPEMEIAALCAEYGLKICSVHENHDLILCDPGRVAANLDAFGCACAVYPIPRGIDLANAAAIDDMIGKLNATGRLLAGEGRQLAYHNHNHEFRQIAGDVILERIYRETDPHYLKAELDTYWIQYGGGDIIAWCRRLHGRLTHLHLKDYRTTQDNIPEFAEVGHGVLDFKPIIGAAEQAGCAWFVVEQDRCPGDPFVSLERSFQYIAGHLLAS